MRHALLCVLLVLSACDHRSASVAPPPAAGDALLIWVTGGGWTTLTVWPTGRARYEFKPTGWGSEGRAPSSHDGVIAPDDLLALMKTLAAHHACSLHAPSRLPVPEEHSNSLAVTTTEMNCRVEMLSGDWNDGDAGAVRLALDAATQQVKEQAPRD
jgi:hypothetical protein